MKNEKCKMKKGNNIAVDPKRPDGAVAMSWLAFRPLFARKGLLIYYPEN
jgi:hypothetical protein